jgi:hypothetical protein
VNFRIKATKVRRFVEKSPNKRENVMSRKFAFCLFVGFIMGGFSLQSACADGQTPPASRPSDSAADIKAALSDPTAMEFTDTPLCDVIEYLKDYHHQKHPAFEIVLDTKALNELGVTSDTPITKNLKGIKLRSALRLLLRDLGLTFRDSRRSADDHFARRSREAAPQKGL